MIGNNDLQDAVEEQIRHIHMRIEETKHALKRTVTDSPRLGELVIDLRALNVRLTELQATRDRLRDGKDHAE